MPVISSIPDDAEDGQDFISKFRDNLNRTSLSQVAIDDAISKAATLWNDGLSKGRSTLDNITNIKTELPNLDIFGLGEAVDTGKKAIDTAISTIEFIKDNWWKIILLIGAVTIGVIIVYAIFVLQPALEAMLLGMAAIA